MKKLLTGLAVVLMLVACSEDEPGTNTSLDKLTNDEWNFSEWYVNYSSAGIEYTMDLYAHPEYAYWDSCILDDRLSFYDDHTYQTKPGADLCDLDISLFLRGEWQVLEDTISFEPYGVTNAWNYYLIELSDSLLKFSDIITLSSGDGSGETIPANRTFVYRH